VDLHDRIIASHKLSSSVKLPFELEIALWFCLLTMFHYPKKRKPEPDPDPDPKTDNPNSLVTVYSEDVEDELRAKNLNHFVSRNVCNSNELVFTVYENERWHPILKSWGSVGGVHLSDVFDRRHLTDESGNKALRCAVINIMFQICTKC
jgi:hypothetical protein